MSIGKSAIAFARRTFRPFSSVALDTVGFLGLIGFELTVGWSTATAAAVAGVVLILLLARSGVELQHELDRRSSAGIRIDLRKHEKLRDDLLVDGDTLTGRSGFWVKVTNNGPPGRFAARVANVHHAAHAGSHEPVDPDEYEVERVAWSDTADAEITIPRGHAATLRLLEHALVTAQRLQMPTTTFYFLTARGEEWNPGGHGAGWRLEPARVDQPIEFDLTITNVTADVGATWRLSIGYDEATHQVFRVVRVPDAEPLDQ